MTRRLVLSYLAIAVFVLLVLEVPLGISYARSALERRTVDLERDAGVVASFVEDGLEHGTPVTLPDWLAMYPAEAGVRVLVTDREGITVLDSDAPVDAPRDYSTRPEIVAALEGRRDAGTRYSETLGQDLLYVAVPVSSGGVVHGAVRLTHPRTALDASIRDNWLLLGGIALVVLAVTGVVGVLIARSVTRPTRELEHAAAQLAAGDLDARAPTDAGPPELRDLADRFNHMAARLGELIATQRDFVADASHQLRSPVAALRLELENLAELAGSRGELAEGLERAVGSTRRLGRIVDGLLMLARTEASDRHVEAMDVPTVVRDRASGWRPLADERGVLIDVDVRQEHVTALGATEHLAQILDNLLANALEVAPSHSVVRLTVDTTPTHVEVHVVDHGPGMSAEQRARAFDRFWRSPTARPGGGSGLGLPIARRLARAGGGDLLLETSPGHGVDATVLLPRDRAGTATGIRDRAVAASPRRTGA